MSANVAKSNLFFEKCLEFVAVKKSQKDGCAQKWTAHSASICAFRGQTFACYRGQNP
jgi:hypothetical protein